VPFSGWPISREELEPFYDRADRVLQLGPRISYPDLCVAFGLQAPGFDPDKLYMECAQWSPKPNFGTTYRQELKSAVNISVLLHANVTSIVTNDSATAVEKIEFRTLTGKQGTAKARVYVICCGGIETARLLLASDRVEPQGLGNRHDLVGRFFQEHIHIRFGDLLTNGRKCRRLFRVLLSKWTEVLPVITFEPASTGRKARPERSRFSDVRRRSGFRRCGPKAVV